MSSSFECAADTDLQERYCSEPSENVVKEKSRKKHKKDINKDASENFEITKVKHKKKHKEHWEECESVSPQHKKKHRHKILVNMYASERSENVYVKHKKKQKISTDACESSLEQREYFKENRERTGGSVGLKKKKKKHYRDEEKDEDCLKAKNKEDIKEYETSSVKQNDNSKEDFHNIGEITGESVNLKKKHKKKHKYCSAKSKENVQENTKGKHKKKHKEGFKDISIELQDKEECEVSKNTKHKKKHKTKDVEVFENKKTKHKKKHVDNSDTLESSDIKRKKFSQNTEVLEQENLTTKKRHKRHIELFEEDVSNNNKHKQKLEVVENVSENLKKKHKQDVEIVEHRKHKKKHKQNAEVVEMQNEKVKRKYREESEVDGTEKQCHGLEELTGTKGKKKHRLNTSDISLECDEHSDSCVPIKVKQRNSHDLEGSVKLKHKKKHRQDCKESQMAEKISRGQKMGSGSIEKETVKLKPKRNHGHKDKINNISVPITEHHHGDEANLEGITLSVTTDPFDSEQGMDAHRNTAKKRKKHGHFEDGKVNDNGDSVSLNVNETPDNVEDRRQEDRREINFQEDDVIIIESESDDCIYDSSKVLSSDVQGSEWQDVLVDIGGNSDSGAPVADQPGKPNKYQHFVYIIQQPDDDITQITDQLEEITQSSLRQDGLNEEAPVGVSCDITASDNANDFCWSLSEEERLQNNWNRYFQDHPFDEPDKLLDIPEDASLEEKRQIWRICSETNFLECLVDGIDKPLPVIRDKARSMFIKNISTSRKSTTLSVWSDTEIKQLENNWKEFFTDYPMDNPYELLSPVHLLSRERHSWLMKFKKQTSFMERLRQGISRSALSVYHKAKRHFYPYTEVTGKFSDEEMLELKKLITIYGKKLLLISTLMGRNPTHIEFQFKQLERQEKNCVTGKWSPEEEKRLIEAVNEQVGFDVTDNEHCFDKKRFSKLSWCKIAEKVQTRDFFQCFQKWMYTYCTVKHSRTGDVVLERKLLKLIEEQNVEEYRDIDWLAIYEQIQTVPSPNSLKKLFCSMCRKVPNREKKSHKDVLATLLRVYDLCCAKPVIVSYT